MDEEGPTERDSYPLYFGVGGALMLGIGFWIAIIGLMLMILR